MARTRVIVLFGGRSVEHNVSLVSARAIIQALDPEQYQVIPVAVTKDGQWLPPAASAALLPPGTLPDAGPAANGHRNPTAVVTEQPSSVFPEADVLFPVIHGTHGEDGTVQGLLELANLPYVGAGVLASALGMDKDLMKRVFRGAGLPVAPFITFRRDAWEGHPADVEQAVTHSLGFPCFVKPANGGSSVGISKVNHPTELRPALDLAFSLDRKAIVEQGVAARELECSVLGNDDPIASVVGEVAPTREFYDYEAKYHDDSTRLIIPANIPDAVSAKVRALAVQAFQAIDCAGMARVDFFYQPSDGAVLVNEINTIPGFTPVSMYPRMWEASGLSYGPLLHRLIELALDRHHEKARTNYRAGLLAQQQV